MDERLSTLDAPAPLPEPVFELPPEPEPVAAPTPSSPPPDSPEDSYSEFVWEASSCRALLLEILRRGIHDWVLYKNHERLELKRLAQSAYVWLFEEEPGHPDWEERQRAPFEAEESGESLPGARALTSFLGICAAVDLDPETVRERARKMTVQSIMFPGRPVERRKSTKDDAPGVEEYGVSASGFEWQQETQYDGFTPYTPEYV